MERSPQKTESAASSSSGEAHPFTSRGRVLDASYPVKGPNPLGNPLMGRQRSNSLRRLPIEHLQGLADGPSSHVSAGAQRELDVRKMLVVESQHQFPDSAAPKMHGKGPIGMREASAIRFASSMAEEALDEINRLPGRVPQPVGQIGVASVQGHLGVGFSGKSAEMDHTREVEGRMLDLQRHYDAQGQSRHWSGRLQPVAVRDVFAQDDGNICAAKRAALVAHTMAGNTSPFAPPVGRHQIPPADSVVEMMTPATSSRAQPNNIFREHTVAQNLTDRSAFPDLSPASATISGRPRSKSVDSMANSCGHCMAEHREFMARRQSSSRF